MPIQINLDDIVKKITPNLGTVLNELFQAGKVNLPGEKHVDELEKQLPCDIDQRYSILIGALAILQIIGLITIDSTGNVRVTSRLAHFAIGSLSKFFIKSTPVFGTSSNDRIEEKHLVDFIKSFESIRLLKLNGREDPLHNRSIVNVIIKSKQIRRGRKQDVYLHVYHPNWNAYHLVGIGKKKSVGTSDELASMAMEREQLLLLHHDYELKTWSTDFPKITEISRSTGVITEYAYSIMIANKISKKLLFKKWASQKGDWNNRRFKWFTLEEIENLRGNDGQKIFFSTPTILRCVPPQEIPISVVKADDATMSLTELILTKFTYGQISLILGTLLIFLFSILCPECIMSILSKIGVQNTYLQNISAIIQLITGVIFFLSFMRRFF
jgi:hypothetical protein